MNDTLDIAQFDIRWSSSETPKSAVSTPSPGASYSCWDSPSVSLSDFEQPNSTPIWTYQPSWTEPTIESPPVGPDCAPVLPRNDTRLPPLNKPQVLDVSDYIQAAQGSRQAQARKAVAMTPAGPPSSAFATLEVDEYSRYTILLWENASSPEAQTQTRRADLPNARDSNGFLLRQPDLTYAAACKVVKVPAPKPKQKVWYQTYLVPEPFPVD